MTTTVEEVTKHNDKVNIISKEVNVKGEKVKLITHNVETGNTYYILMKKANGVEHRYPSNVDYETLSDAVDLFNFLTLFA